MKFPFKIIESKISARNEFDVVDGCQPTHALFYLKEGRFVMETDGKRYEVMAGDCVILPDYLHFKRSVLEPIVFVYVKFCYDEQCPIGFSLPAGKVEFSDRARFCADIAQLEALFEKDDALSNYYRTHILNDILLMLSYKNGCDGYENNLYSIGDKLTATAVSYIKDNISRKIVIEDVCRAVSTNPSTLNFRFNKYLGRSVGKFIADTRIKTAKHLLVSTSYPVYEVAVRTGFDNTFYFSNVFKKAVGLSPLQYRKLNQPI